MKLKTQSKLAVAVQAALILGISSQVSANEDIESITVTANRSAQNALDVLASQIVIDREQIEQIQPDSTLDLLRTVAGLDFTQQGGFGQQSSVFVRGANANHTLVLVDGMRVGSATLGTTEVQSIAPAMIERIEIVKGPRAALWGSDAIGGVIQIFTRKLQGGEANAELTLGSEGHQQLQGAIGFSHGNGSSTVSLTKQKADGFDVFAPADPDDDGYDYTAFSLRGEQVLSEVLKINWLYANNSNEAEYDSAWTAGDEVSETDNHVWQLAANYQHELGGFKHSTDFSLGQSQDSNKQLLTGDLFETKRTQISAVNTTPLENNLLFVTGLDLVDEQIESSTTAYGEDERLTFGLFGQVGYQLAALNLESAIRYDDVEGVDSELSYNLGLGYDINESISLVLTHGTGFKVPTFNDLYFPSGQYSVGNPDLEAERSVTEELIIKYSEGLIALEASIYQSEIENLIEWAADASDNFRYKPANIREAEIKGFELSVSYIGQMFTHKVNYAYNESKDSATNEQLIRRSKHHFNYTASTKVRDADVYFEYAYKGDAYDSGFDADFNPVRITLPSYSLVSVNIAYPLNDNFTLKAKVANALDEDYVSANNYNTQGRTVYFGIGYQM